ncbi:MAG: beta-propeller fold lactonase family protein [Bdellovibrionota bacterium]
MVGSRTIFILLGFGLALACGKGFNTGSPGSNPVLLSVSPSIGLLHGGTSVTLTGRNFSSSMSASVGGVACTTLSAISSTQATCVTPAHTSGTVDLSVGLGGTPLSTLSLGFTYLQFLYVANGTAGTISSFSISPTTGALTSLGADFSVGGTPTAMAIDSTKQFLYVTTGAGGKIAGYSINSGTGALTAIASGTVTLGAFSVTGIGIEPTHNFLYAGTAKASPNFFGFQVSSTDGSLSALPSSPYNLGGNPTDTVAFHPNVSVVYATAPAGQIVQAFVIAADGSLSNIGGGPFLNPNPTSSMAIDPLARFIYAGYFSIDGKSGYSAPLLSNGAPVNASEVAFTNGAGNGGKGIVAEATGNWVYSANSADALIYEYNVNSGTGGLTSFGSIASAIPNQLVIDSTNTYLYATNSSTVTSYKISASTGALSSIGSSPCGTGANGMVVAR